jgi:hypothetical protein
VSTLLQCVFGRHTGFVSGLALADADFEFHTHRGLDVVDGVLVGGGVHLRGHRDDVVAADEKREPPVLLSEVAHERRVPLFDLDERVELVELIGVFFGRVVHVEVSDRDVVGSVGDGRARQHLSAVAVAGAPDALESLGGLFQRDRRIRVHADAQTDGDRIPVAGRLLQQSVVVFVEPVGHRDHVVESREEGVPPAMTDELCDVGEESRLKGLEVHLAARFGCHCPRPVVVDLNERQLRFRHGIEETGGVQMALWFGTAPNALEEKGGPPAPSSGSVRDSAAGGSRRDEERASSDLRPRTRG